MLKRRGFLSGLVLMPVVIRTPGLLMAVRPWRGLVVPLTLEMPEVRWTSYENGVWTYGDGTTEGERYEVLTGPRYFARLG